MKKTREQLEKMVSDELEEIAKLEDLLSRKRAWVDKVNGTIATFDSSNPPPNPDPPLKH